MIIYPENTSSFEQWQQGYVYGVILILPPPHVSNAIHDLRRQYDPVSAAISPPHISVTDPLAGPLSSAKRLEVCEQLASFSSFEIFYNDIVASNEWAGVSYTIEPQQPIDELKLALHSTSAFSRIDGKRRKVPPHMTIAEFISIEDSLALHANIRHEVPTGSFICRELAYMVPDEQFRFRKVDVFSLGQD